VNLDEIVREMVEGHGSGMVLQLARKTVRGASGRRGFLEAWSAVAPIATKEPMI